MLEILLSSRETVWCHGNACIGAMAHFGIIVVLSNRNLHASGGVGRPNLSPLLARSSAAGPSTLPQSHQIHHAYYASGRLVSATYRSGEGNNTPFFLIPTVLVGAGIFFLLPLELFVVTAIVARHHSMHTYCWIRNIMLRIRDLNGSLGLGASSSSISSIICMPTETSR
jgi:hypothetical protein